MHLGTYMKLHFLICKSKQIIAIDIDPMFKDQEPCRRFLAGLCPNTASDCKFKHITWPAGKTTICTWFNSKGKGCNKGAGCPQAHIAVGQPALDFIINKRGQHPVSWPRWP